MPTPRLNHLIANGTERNALGFALADPHIACADGFCLSVLAPDPADVLLLPALTLEVGFPTQRPEPWDRWREYLEHAENEGDPTESVYLHVPVALVRELIETHGGEILPSPLRIPRQRP
ncbi:hypothetical protein ACFY2K_39985 [Kitasatospora sp. NPDC001309]|uniref:hypothetical protein n=1 Tax=Kitasatospora sp. NPDC001309 TaxID=3364013 RepID=UPI00367A9956